MPSVFFFCRSSDNGHMDTGAKAPPASSIFIVGSQSRIDDKRMFALAHNVDARRRNGITNRIRELQKNEGKQLWRKRRWRCDDGDEDGIYGFGKSVQWWNDTERKLNTVHVKVIFQPFALACVVFNRPSSGFSSPRASRTSLSPLFFFFFILIFIECFNLTPFGFFDVDSATSAIY